MNINLIPTKTRPRWRIRKAAEADARRLLGYMTHIASEPINNTSVRPGIAPATETQELSVIRAHRYQPNSAIFIAEINHEIAGMIRCDGGSSPFDAHTITISINVLSDYRGQGLGSALIRHALEWAKEQGFIRRVQLEVIARNTGAIRLYERLGFETEGVRRNAYRLTDEADQPFQDSFIMAYYL
jgi:ribosomal protein S18 acetylase RimI-like enzyme